MPEDNPLANIIGDLAEPFSKLIEKVSKGCSNIYEPTHRKRIAKADAEVRKINAFSDLEITEIQKRALRRSLNEEGKNQENIENLLLETRPHLNEDAKPEEIEDDWITNFFDKAKIVSDKEMQRLWAKLLAGEANNPGTYSKRTVNYVGDLDKSDANLFTNFCSFSIQSGELLPVIYDVEHSTYKSSGINFGALSHLDEIGLIKFNHLSDFHLTAMPETTILLYSDKRIIMEISNDSDNQFIFGKAKFTKIGQELAPIANAKPVDGFLDYLLEKWEALGYKIILPIKQ